MLVQIAAVSHSMQLNDDDILSAAQTDHEQEERANLSRIPRPPPQAPGPMDSVLPTINESAQSTANSSPAVSTCTGSGSLISHGSDPAASEFAFDILDVPDVVEARAVVGGTAGGEIVERQVNESGQAVITVVLSEQERQLKDSAKEMHEQSKGKGKADAAEPAGRHDDPAQVSCRKP